MSKKGKDNCTDDIKVRWDDDQVRALVELVVELMRSSKRAPGERMPKLEWEVLSIQFNTKTGLNYPKQVLKNKWDVLRKDWILWTKLRHNETGIGWDNVTQTVTASDEWWNQKIKENKEYAKFRKHGFKNKDDLEFCFTGSYATGSYCMTPSSGFVPTASTQVDDGVDTWFEDDVYIPRLVVDLGDNTPAEVNIFDQADDMSIGSSPVKQTPVTPTQATISSTKRSNQGSVSRPRKKKNVEDDKMVDRLVTAVESYAATSAANIAKTKTNEAADAVNTLVEMSNQRPMSDELFYFATELLENKDARDVFMAVPPQRRYGYLEHKFKKQ